MAQQDALDFNAVNPALFLEVKFRMLLQNQCICMGVKANPANTVNIKGDESASW